MSLVESIESLYQIRVDSRTITNNVGAKSKLENLQTTLHEKEESFLSNLEIYLASSKEEDTRAAIDELKTLFTESYMPSIDESLQKAMSSDNAGAMEALKAPGEQIQEMFDKLDFIIDNRMISANETNQSNTRLAIVLIIILAVVIILGVVAAIILGRIISGAISKPIADVVEAAEQISLGRVDVDLSGLTTKDEIGTLAAAFTKMSAGIKLQVNSAEAISNGDFSHTVPLRSEYDVLGLALQKIEQELNRTLTIVNQAADQVNTGAEQVSSAAQTLSSGATEQAATMQQLNASIVSVARQAEENASNVKTASQYMQQASKDVADSNVHMQHLNTSMQEIGESSQQISKITKLVEDIAFQTNILALNAAVEAARAGNAGKGFAVVADEVRNLAAKSAEAAKQTADLIQKSVETVADGERLASDTSKLLDVVAEQALRVDQTIREIEKATNEQASAIEQINQGLSQVSSVVQNNAATAEESSAASEELAAQAQSLQHEVSRFHLTVSDESYLSDEIQPAFFDEFLPEDTAESNLDKY